jgi:hypothetical protein
MKHSMVAQPFWVKVKLESTDMEILGVLPKLQTNMFIFLMEDFMVTALKKVVPQQGKLTKS